MWERTINEIAAKAKAYEIIKAYAFSRADEIILEDIAMARGVLVLEGKLKGAEARLVRSGHSGIIRVNDNIPEEGRKRFAIAHDLGHWELHQNESQMNLYFEEGVDAYYASPVEIEANIFASELLMPSKLFRPLCQDISPNLSKIKDLAKEFKTTLSAAALRFVDETEHSCAIVFSQNGSIKWWKKSSRCEEIFFGRKESINRYSLAWDCFNNKSVPEEGERVSAEAWIKRNYDIDKVFEQSMRLGRYDTILSLIWID